MYPDPERSGTRSCDASPVPAFYQLSPQRPQGGRRQACGYLVNPRREGRVAGRPRPLRPGRRQGFFLAVARYELMGPEGSETPDVAPLRLRTGQGVARGLARESGTLKQGLKRAGEVATIQRRAHLRGQHEHLILRKVACRPPLIP